MKNFTLFLFILFSANFLNAQNRANQMLANIIKQDSAFQANEFSNPDQPFPDISIEARQRRNDFYKNELGGLRLIKTDDLSEQEKINYEMLRFVLEDRVAAFESGFYQIPMNAEGGWFSDFVLRAGNYSFDSVEDVEKYFEAITAFPAYNEAHLDLMRKGMLEGRTLPKFLVNNSLEMVKTQCVDLPGESHFFSVLDNMSDNISEGERKKLRRQGRTLVAEKILPAYRKLRGFLQNEYMPEAVDAYGVSACTGGMEYYAQRVKYFTTLDMTPDEVFEIGQNEVARIKKEMEAIIQELEFEGSFSDFLKFLRTDEQFYAGSPREILGYASYLSKKIDGLLPNYFYKLPRNSYGVQPVPAAIAPNYTSGRYSPGSLTQGRAGNYWVNTTMLKSRPLYAMPALTLHEAVPGHHLQISLAQEMEGLPAFRRNTYLSAFGEGWALYGEWLGEEMGIYETPYERFGKLTYEMWRACRLVVDPGLHVKGWSRQEAIDFLSENTALSIHECTTEIDRYIGWPGQAVSYKIGELTIRRLRAKAEDELGEQFDLRAFHDLLLSNGSVPLFILEGMVNDWVAEKKQ